jgi:LysM repeat protein
MRLVIPVAPGKEGDTTKYARAITRYRIREGDTVESVAENLGVSAKIIRVWNRLKGNSLAGRKILLVHLPVTPGAGETQLASKRSSSHRASSSHSPSARGPSGLSSGSPARTETATTGGVVHHKVKPGETLYSIANSYNTTVAALKHDNQNIATLRPGMILVIRDLR